LVEVSDFNTRIVKSSWFFIKFSHFFKTLLGSFWVSDSWTTLDKLFEFVFALNIFVSFEDLFPLIVDAN
jgi:hypothetical protein